MSDQRLTRGSVESMALLAVGVRDSMFSLWDCGKLGSAQVC